MVYVIPLLCFVVPLIAGVVAMRHRQGWAVWAMAGLAALIMIWAIREGRQAQGWDGIGYGILALLMAAPVMLGALVGGAVGWWRRRKAAQG